jgi:hypothetical protein
VDRYRAERVRLVRTADVPAVTEAAR